MFAYLLSLYRFSLTKLSVFGSVVRPIVRALFRMIGGGKREAS